MRIKWIENKTFLRKQIFANSYIKFLQLKKLILDNYE